MIVCLLAAEGGVAEHLVQQRSALAGDRARGGRDRARRMQARWYRSGARAGSPGYADPRGATARGPPGAPGGAMRRRCRRDNDRHRHRIDQPRQQEPPWPRSTRSSSSATSAATPRCATRPTARGLQRQRRHHAQLEGQGPPARRQEETEWHRVVFFDRLAEIAGEYLKKGRSVYVEGRLKTRKWHDKDGVEKYTTEIIATDMQMLGSREGMGGGGGGDDGGGDGSARRRRARRAPPAAEAGGEVGHRLRRHGRRHPVLGAAPSRCASE